MIDGKILVVFDMDGVLVHERSSWRVVHDSLGTSNEDSYQAYLRGEIDDLEFMRRDIGLWRGKGINRTSDVENILSGVTLMKGFHECMKGLRGSGATLGMISGGLDLLANRLGTIGGFTHVRANGLSADERGILSGEGILRVPLNDKASVLRAISRTHGPFARTFVVGDSRVDISMFGPSDLSIAFRPEERAVEMAADMVVNEPDLGMVLKLLAEMLL